MSLQSRPRRPLLAALWAIIAVSQFGYFGAGGRQWHHLIGPLCALALAGLYAFRPQVPKSTVD